MNINEHFSTSFRECHAFRLSSPTTLATPQRPIECRSIFTLNRFRFQHRFGVVNSETAEDTSIAHTQSNCINNDKHEQLIHLIYYRCQGCTHTQVLVRNVNDKLCHILVIINSFTKFATYSLCFTMQLYSI